MYIYIYYNYVVYTYDYVYMYVYTWVKYVITNVYIYNYIQTDILYTYMHIAGVLLPPMSLWGSIASLCLAFRCVQHLNGLGTCYHWTIVLQNDAAEPPWGAFSAFSILFTSCSNRSFLHWSWALLKPCNCSWRRSIALKHRSGISRAVAILWWRRFLPNHWGARWTAGWGLSQHHELGRVWKIFCLCHGQVILEWLCSKACLCVDQRLWRLRTRLWRGSFLAGGLCLQRKFWGTMRSRSVKVVNSWRFSRTNHKLSEADSPKKPPGWSFRSNRDKKCNFHQLSLNFLRHHALTCM